MSPSSRSYALFGGTFDPIHMGHLAVAEAALGWVDEVVFIPAGQSPLKSQSPAAGAEHRWLMAVLATLDNPAFRVVRWEIERPGPSYTIDTLRRAPEWLHAPDARLHWLIGSDAMWDIARWREPQALFERAQFLVIPRREHPEDALRAHLAATAPWLGQDAYRFLPMAPVDVSSTALRERLLRGEDVRDALPPAVARYVARYGLYRENRETM